MNNIKFSYLYRDAGNYKNYGQVIFDNPHSLSINEFEELIRTKLIDGQWFYTKDWKLPDLHFKKWDDELDHSFHEFENLSPTEESVNAPLSFDHFYELVKETNWKY